MAVSSDFRILAHSLLSRPLPPRLKRFREDLIEVIVCLHSSSSMESYSFACAPLVPFSFSLLPSLCGELVFLLRDTSEAGPFGSAFIRLVGWPGESSLPSSGVPEALVSEKELVLLGLRLRFLGLAAVFLDDSDILDEPLAPVVGLPSFCKKSIR